MSHSSGEVIINNQCVGWFEYNGTSDIALPAVHSTREEMQAHWRNQPWIDCTCESDPTDVTLYAHYGGGFHWKASVCFACKTIVSGIDPFPDDCDFDITTDGDPRKQNVPRE